MARGNRSEQRRERTEEERELARQERARRRAAERPETAFDPETLGESPYAELEPRPDAADLALGHPSVPPTTPSAPGKDERIDADSEHVDAGGEHADAGGEDRHAGVDTGTGGEGRAAGFDLVDPATAPHPVEGASAPGHAEADQLGAGVQATGLPEQVAPPTMEPSPAQEYAAEPHAAEPSPAQEHAAEPHAAEPEPEPHAAQVIETPDGQTGSVEPGVAGADTRPGGAGGPHTEDQEGSHGELGAEEGVGAGEPLPRPPARRVPARGGRRGAAAPRARGLPPLPPPPGRPVSGRSRPRVRGEDGGRRAMTRLGAVVALVVVVLVLLLVVRPALKGKHALKPAPPPAATVLVPPGKTRPQIAEIAAADGLVGSYRVASRHSALLNPTRYGAPANTPDLEGFLFPDTFDIDRGAPVSQLVEAQLEDFKSKFGSSQIAAARALHVTPYGLLTVASMVEREAQIPKDAPLIAAVIYNRLNAGMPLGIDASIYYAVELASGVATYTHELTEAQLHINSPYNTRLHTGLPPTPISNPGLASIEAAAHPAHVPYLYYVAGADGCGEQVFSTTQAEFEVEAAAYHAAVARNGGRPPTCRKR